MKISRVNTIIHFLKTFLRKCFAYDETESEAIKGHAVNRYRYATHLLKNKSDENLIKAYCWLSLAADEIDMKTEASRLKHQVQYAIKQRGLLGETLLLENKYREIYSCDALRSKIKNSWNPINIFLYRTMLFMEFIGKHTDRLLNKTSK